MTTMTKPGLDMPVHSPQDLVDYLAGGARPRKCWGIGAESEKLVIMRDSGEAANYSEIAHLLSRLEGTSPWRGVRERDLLIALSGANSSVTLEPGGQLELSGELCPDIHCCWGDFLRHHQEVIRAAEGLGIAFLGLGVQPFTALDKIDWIPKGRYRVMGPYMSRTGDMGQRMMKQSAGLQVNLDFADEADCILKLRLSLALAPLFYALFANSPLLEGKPSGFLSTRGEIWDRTDPERTGLLPEIFAEGAGFPTYVEWALDVPMYFIYRNDAYLDLTRERFTFRRYLREGHGAHRATLADWDMHLSTLFPEARLRPQIELRSADSLPPRLTMAVAALVKGIMYDSQALAQVWEIFRHQSAQERQVLNRAAWRQGLRASMGSRTLQQVALEVVQAARAGLARQQVRDDRGLDETVYLDEIAEIAESGITLAERLLQRWRGDRNEKVAALIDHCGFNELTSNP